MTTVLTLFRLWIDPCELVLVDTGDIFDLCGIAYRNSNQELQHACEQVVEHDNMSYWIQQYRSHQLLLQKSREEFDSPQVHAKCRPAGEEAELEETDAEKAELQAVIQLSKEEYERKISNDQAIAGPGGTKRTRSLTADTNPHDDLCSLPSSAKRSRNDSKTSSTSSSKSSGTLKEDSQFSKSSLDMEKTPSLAEVRRLRGMVFIPQFTAPSQNTDGQEDTKNREAGRIQPSSSSASSFSSAVKPRRFLDMVDSAKSDEQKEKPDSTRKRLTEYARSGSLLGMDSAAGAWTVEQDAELIRLKERVTPAPSWLQIVDILRARFPGVAHFKRMTSSQPRTHYERMIREGATASQGNVSLNGLLARKAALAFLDKEDSEQSQSPKNRSYHKYTKEEDLEIIRLKEVAMPSKSWADIADTYDKKFGVFLHSNNRGQLLRARYSKLKPKSGQCEEDPPTDTDTDSEESEAEEVREDWMAGSSTHSSMTPWTKSEDAELIHLRERTEPRPSWQETVDALNRKFYEKASGDPPRNYNNTRQRWRQMSGDKNCSKAGLALRKEALALLSDTDITFTKSSPSSFSAEEDIELVKLRDEEMPGSAWVEITEMFNSRMHVKPGYQERSGSSLYSHYERTRSKWKESDDGMSISMLEFVQNRGMLTNSKVWTSAQDDALAKVKKNMTGKPWFEVARAFNGYCEEKEWPVRNPKSVEQRFNRHLRSTENDQQ